VSAKDPNEPLYRRHRTRYRGITYRKRADGSRRYFVYAQGKQHPVEGGEREALSKQAELRGRIARGERLAPANARFGPVAEEWYASKRKLRTSTLERYRTALDLWLLPRLEHLKLAQITPDVVAALIRNMEEADKSGATIINNLKPLGGTFTFAIRRGLAAQNPLAALTPDERPRAHKREFRELGPEELERLLCAAERFDYFPLVRTALYTGCRQGELLGLAWSAVDFEHRCLRIERQWSRGEFGEPKTPAAVRQVVLAPNLVAFLRAHKARSRYSTADDLVFASRRGTPLSARNVCRAFTKMVAEAKLDGEPPLTFHGLRHIYASMMIERGITSTVLAEQMGHTSSTITEQRYVHLFNRVRTDEAVRAAVQEAMELGKSLTSTVGNQREPGEKKDGREAAVLRAFRPAASR
jgi:integrase